MAAEIQQQPQLLSNAVSIMGCTYNRLICTQQMLASLDALSDFPYHLILLDNGSTDDTVRFLRNYKPTNTNCLSLDIYFNEENKGIHIGRNQLLVLSHRYNDRFLCAIDNDVEFLPNWLSRCTSFLNDNPNWMIGINYEAHTFPIEEINGHSCQKKGFGNLGTACMMSLRSQVFDQIGYYDHDLKHNYSCEDSLYFWRAHCATQIQTAYLAEHGKHLGEGAVDDFPHPSGMTYREWKTFAHKDTNQTFHQYCRQYSSRQRPLYIGFDWQPDPAKLLHWER